jgi:nitrogen fixation NifU-like protein
MKIYLKIEDDIIEEVSFETLGCAAAIAVSSALTDLVKGKTLDEALKITKDQIVEDLGGLPSPKIHCSMLGVEALHEAIKEYKK